MNKIEGQIRQGDVLVENIAKPTQKLKKLNKITLAYGEKTGHAHVIESQSARAHIDQDGLATEFEIREAVALLKHDEHRAAPIKKSVKTVIHQSEYSPAEIRRVED